MNVEGDTLKVSTIIKTVTCSESPSFRSAHDLPKIRHISPARSGMSARLCCLVCGGSLELHNVYPDIVLQVIPSFGYMHGFVSASVETSMV